MCIQTCITHITCSLLYTSYAKLWYLHWHLQRTHCISQSLIWFLFGSLTAHWLIFHWGHWTFLNEPCHFIMQLPPHLGFIISASLLMAYTASPSILAGRGWLWETWYRTVGGGEMGVVRCPCSGEATYTHSPNLWRSAVLEADCIARLLSLLQIMSLPHNRDKWCDLQTNEAASSSSPRESKPRGSDATCVDTVQALMGRVCTTAGGKYRG